MSGERILWNVSDQRYEICLGKCEILLFPPETSGVSAMRYARVSLTAEVSVKIIIFKFSRKFFITLVSDIPQNSFAIHFNPLIK